MLMSRPRQEPTVRQRPLWSEELNEEELMTDDELEDRMIKTEWRAFHERRAGDVVGQEKIPTEPLVASLPVRATAAPLGRAKYLLQAGAGLCVFEWIGQQPPNVGLHRRSGGLHHQEEVLLPAEEPQTNKPREPPRSSEKNPKPKEPTARYLFPALPLEAEGAAVGATAIGGTATQAAVISPSSPPPAAPPPPVDMMKELYSVGAKNHFAGKCQVCVFFLKGTCKNYQNCQYCHAPHSKDPRPDKKTRQRTKVKDLKLRLEEIDAEIDSLSTGNNPQIARELAKLVESKRLVSTQLAQSQEVYSAHKASIRANRKKLLEAGLSQPQKALKSRGPRLLSTTVEEENDPELEDDSGYNSGFSTSTATGRSSGSSTYDELGWPKAPAPPSPLTSSKVQAAVAQISKTYGLSFDGLQHQK